jgi:hypothetical protein
MKKPIPLPSPCPLCRPYGGRWRSTDDGLGRCLCPRGVMLAAGKVKRVRPPVSGKRDIHAVKYSPLNPHAVSRGGAESVQVHDGKMSATGEK